MQEYSTDESKVSVHWCYPIGRYRSAWHEDSWRISTVSVRRPERTERGTLLSKTVWRDHRSLPPGRWTAPGVYVPDKPYRYDNTR